MDKYEKGSLVTDRHVSPLRLIARIGGIIAEIFNGNFTGIIVERDRSYGRFRCSGYGHEFLERHTSTSLIRGTKVSSFNGHHAQGFKGSPIELNDSSPAGGAILPLIVSIGLLSVAGGCVPAAAGFAGEHETGMINRSLPKSRAFASWCSVCHSAIQRGKLRRQIKNG